MDRDLNTLVDRLNEIKHMGWIENRRPGNVGGVGNTLEDLLEVAENNYQLPDFGQWELKSQRRNSNSLLTLFHCEPFPREDKIVANVLLPLYGWPHREAGNLYSDQERSFRQTLCATSTSDRGFTVNVDTIRQCIYISFDFSMIGDQHSEWREYVRSTAGTGNIVPTPYWPFTEISSKLEAKLNYMFYVGADRKVEHGTEYYKYNSFDVYLGTNISRFISCIESGQIYVDFDARTGHNHGTKFRMNKSARSDLYEHHLNI